MWNKINQMRNRFLQCQLPYLKSGVINDYVTEEFRRISDNECPKTDLRSIQPAKCKILGEDKVNISYGSWGLPKIIKDICHSNLRIQMCAMITLSEFLLDELECRRAIVDFDIVRRLQNILLRRRSQVDNDQDLIPPILRCYGILALKLHSAMQMAMRPHLVRELFIMAGEVDISRLAAPILRNMTDHPEVLEYFVYEKAWFKVLYQFIKKNLASVELDLLEHFCHFLAIDPQSAINHGFFEFAKHEIAKPQNGQQILLKCFAFLLDCKEGQEEMDKSDGFDVLYNLLQDEQLETHEYVVLCLQSATAASRTCLLGCKNYPDLPQALIRRAHDKDNERQQLYSLQTLRQITAVPDIKDYVRKVCIPQIRSVYCPSERVKHAKEALLKWLKTDIYRL